MGHMAAAGFCILTWLSACAGASPFTVNIDLANTIASTPSTFAPTFGWEMAVMQGHYLNTGLLDDPVYIAAASHLRGSVVRVGGITADWAFYVINDTDTPSFNTAATNLKTTEETLDGYWPVSETNFSTGDFRKLLAFFNATGLRLLFDLNELHGRNCQTVNPATNQSDWCVGPWDTSNVRAFLTYVHDNDLVGGSSPLIGFELGNELVTHLDARDNTNDLVTLAGIIADIWSDVPAASIPPLYGPSTDNCFVNDTHAIMQNVTGVIRGFTYHAYPGGSGVAPSPTLEEILLNVTWLRTLILTESDSQQCIDWWQAGPRDSGMELWVTESSSSWNFQLPAPAQNSFLHGFFTLSELGQYASTGVGAVARWAFSEPSPFGTIVQNGSRWDVAADFFLLVTYKQLMGSGVLGVTDDPAAPMLVYAQCSTYGNGSVTLMAVNPSSFPVILQLTANATTGTHITHSSIDGGITSAPLPPAPRMEYVFTAPGGNISSFTPQLNGGAPLRLGVDGSLPLMAGTYVSNPAQPIVLPPLSQAFFVLLQAGAAAC